MALDADDRFIYDQGRGRLYYDADGSGEGDMELMAKFGRGTEISVDDFDVI